MALQNRGNGGRRRHPLLGVGSISTQAPFRPTARSFALNLPNILLNAAAIAAVWNVSRYSFVITFVALQSMLSSLAHGLFGGPAVSVNSRAQAHPTPDHPAEAA